MSVTSATLAEEFATLTLPRFAEPEAQRLGLLLLDLAEDKPVVIDIRTNDRTLFHLALPGSTGVNDLWALRKSATALLFQKPSFQIGTRNRERGVQITRNGLDPAAYSDAGGSVPVVVKGVGVVAAATISGLAEEDDHALVVAALRRLQSEIA